MPLTNPNLKLERNLTFIIEGQTKTGTLVIGDLEWLESKSKWACHWSISYIHPEVGRIYGLDPLDALTKALDFLSSLIRGSERDGLEVWWRQKGDHVGLTFPLCEERNWEKMPPL